MTFGMVACAETPSVFQVVSSFFPLASNVPNSQTFTPAHILLHDGNYGI